MFLAATSPRSFWDFSGCPSVAVGLVRAPGWLSAHLGNFPGSLILRWSDYWLRRVITEQA